MNINIIKWNYNMEEAPKDGTDVLISDGISIWIAHSAKSTWYCIENIWYCVEGMLVMKFIAWAEINLPKLKQK